MSCSACFYSEQQSLSVYLTPRDNYNVMTS